jgi:hypothetical protein
MSHFTRYNKFLNVIIKFIISNRPIWTLLVHGFLKNIQGTWILKFIMAHIGYTTSGCQFLSQGKKMWNVNI